MYDSSGPSCLHPRAVPSKRQLPTQASWPDIPVASNQVCPEPRTCFFLFITLFLVSSTNAFSGTNVWHICWPNSIVLSNILIIWHLFKQSICHLLFGILSVISILAFCLASILSIYVASMIWHSISHRFWHSIWHLLFGILSVISTVAFYLASIPTFFLAHERCNLMLRDEVQRRLSLVTYLLT